MALLSEKEFAYLIDGIISDRDAIIRHNPIGSPEETLLWMLMSCLVSYVSLEPTDTPCFTGRPDAETYRKAILHILSRRKTDDFDPEPYLDKLLA